MHHLLLIAHGSRRQESTDEIHSLVEHIRERADNRYATVECAFLELTEPSIDTAIARSVEDGATRITLLPYFLTDGNHVANDIPAIYQCAVDRFPDTQIELRPYFGSAPAVADLLLELSLS
ncbi:MAG: CbiX/SirB N-terminal domain-containing protein [Pseudomonadota bacterium]